MLEQYGMHNFKAFKSLPALNIKPITILCGMNSCGKSSFLQSLLMLKQSSTQIATDNPLVFQGQSVSLDTYKNAVFRQDLENKLPFDLTLRSNSGHLDNIKISYQSQDEGRVFIDSLSMVRNIDLPFESQQIFRLAFLKEGIYTVDFSDALGQQFVDVTRYNGLIPSLKLFYPIDKYSLIRLFRYKQKANSLLNEIQAELSDLFATISYIGPFRENPSRYYQQKRTDPLILDKSS